MLFPFPMLCYSPAVSSVLLSSSKIARLLCFIPFSIGGLNFLALQSCESRKFTVAMQGIEIISKYKYNDNKSLSSLTQRIGRLRSLPAHQFIRKTFEFINKHGFSSTLIFSTFWEEMPWIAANLLFSFRRLCSADSNKSFSLSCLFLIPNHTYTSMNRSYVCAYLY